MSVRVGRWLKPGDLLRYSKDASKTAPYVDGLPNYHYLLNGGHPGFPSIQLEKGISSPQLVASHPPRRSVLMIRSSAHKFGTDFTPWQDKFNGDDGTVHYHGDLSPKARGPHRAINVYRKLLHVTGRNSPGTSNGSLPRS